MALIEQHSWLLLPVATLLSAGLALLLIPLAHKANWVDHPGERKVHRESTPLVGGVAIYPVLVLVVTLVPALEVSRDYFYLPLLAGSGIMLITGILDDFNDVTPLLRFLVQVLICFLMATFSGVQLTDFGALFSGSVLELGWLSVPITVFAALGVINAFNLIDGLDGLSGGLFMIAALGMVFFAALAGNMGMVWLLAFAMAAVFGFLLLNARFPWNQQARVFLGDAGTLMLGFVLAWTLIRLGNGPDRVFMPMTAVWLFAVPLFDTATLIWRRWREGRSAFLADQNHLHHAFLRAGFTVGEAWTRIIFFALLLAGAGVVLEASKLPEWLSFYCFMALAFVYHFYMKHCWAAQKFLGRHFIHHDFTIEESMH